MASRRIDDPRGITLITWLRRVARASKETVIEDVLAAGFKWREAVKTLGLKTNYYLIFERL